MPKSQAEWNQVAEALWVGAESIIGTIADLRAKDELPETVAVEAGSRFDALRVKMDELMADE